MKNISSPTLDTGIKLVKNVGSINCGRGSIRNLPAYVENRRRSRVSGCTEHVVYLIDKFFASRPDILTALDTGPSDIIEFVGTDEEPKTESIDKLVASLRDRDLSNPTALVGIGGGSTLDTTKAVANLLTNGGRAEDYQGWDLVKRPAVHKIGIPTISGTGSEASRTCVMTNVRSGLKLGMNSDHTIYDHLILDSDLSATVPRNQYFYTGMDAYIHCVESTHGSYRSSLGDAYARETLRLCREVFLSDDMMSTDSRERLMTASYLGGCAIATSYVGVVHPFSAGLSVVLGVHHCIGNCIALNGLGEFYADAHDELCAMAEKQKVSMPRGLCRDLTEAQYRALYDATVIHEKPLTNALGENFRDILTYDKVVSLFKGM